MISQSARLGSLGTEVLARRCVIAVSMDCGRLGSASSFLVDVRRHARVRQASAITLAVVLLAISGVMRSIREKRNRVTQRRLLRNTFACHRVDFEYSLGSA